MFYNKSLCYYVCIYSTTIIHLLLIDMLLSINQCSLY